MPRRSIAIAGAVVATLVLGLAGGLLLFGGSGDGSSTSITQPATTTAAITAAPTSTTTAPTTTTALPGVLIDLSLQGTGQLQTALRAFYAWLGDPGLVDPPEMAEGLQSYLAGVAPEEDLSLVGEFALADLDEETQVAVATVDDDVILAVDEGEGWRIVGAKLPRFDKEAWYGAPVRFVMVIGTDARPGFIEPVFRGDSLHLLTSAIGERAGAVVGFPRDSWVDAPYGGKDKFTHINALAGSEAVVEVARDLTGLPIEGYLVTGFRSFTNLVDAFGGVVVDVPFAMADPKSRAYLRAGEQVLWGQNALAFTRNRSIAGSDFTRSSHQGLVILGALSAVQDRGILELPALLRILTTYIWTDLSAEDLLTLAAGAYEVDPAAVPNIVLPGTITTIGGASVVLLNDAVEEVYRDLEDGLITPSE